MARKQTAGANARGVAKLNLGSRVIGLRLSLAAMDEIETEFEIKNIAELEEKLSAPSAKDIAKLVAILAKAAGEDVSAEEIVRSDADLIEIMDAVRACMTPDRAGPPEKNAPAPSA